jgi:putative endonuclease
VQDQQAGFGSEAVRSNDHVVVCEAGQSLAGRRKRGAADGEANTKQQQPAQIVAPYVTRPVRVDRVATALCQNLEQRATRSRRSYVRGVAAETAACAALERDGWVVLGRRVRMAGTEIDIVAEREGLLAFIEVKARPSLADASFALGAAQRARLLAAGGALLAANPGWGRAGARFDLIVVDATGDIRRIRDAFRQEG